MTYPHKTSPYGYCFLVQTCVIALCTVLLFVMAAILEHRRNYNHAVPVRRPYSQHKRACSALSEVGSLVARERAVGDCYRGLPRQCPNPPTNLNGQVAVNLSRVTMDTIQGQHPEVEDGGRWRPQNCSSPDKIAIFVPLSHEDQRLSLFLRHMHPFLQRQLLDYIIFVIEQTKDKKFNTGLMFNAGVSEALRHKNFDCFVFHDEDLLPENDTNLYNCPKSPTLLSPALSKFGYRRVPHLYGGVMAIPRNDYLRINGYSNIQREDGDDLRHRVWSQKLKFNTVPLEKGRYLSVSSKPEKPNPNRLKLVSGTRDGLNTTQYRLLKMERKPLYTLIYIDPQSGENG